MSTGHKTTTDFIDAISEYWSTHRITVPKDKSLCELVPSAHDYVDQKVINRYYGSVERASDLVKFINKIATLHGNLNYKKSTDVWRKFYTFPDFSDAEKYAKEERLHITQIVNFSEEAPKILYDRIVNAFEIGDYLLAKVQFLAGTTGVGKTTFLKYFSKQYREKLFAKQVVITRVRFRDIQDYRKENSNIDLGTAFRRIIINCIVRDLCACSSFEINQGDLAHSDFSMARRVQIKIQDAVADTLLGLEVLQGFDVDKAIEAFDKDEDFLQELPDYEKSKFILAMKDELRFCIVLDGFDAMRPEEIALFEDNSEAEFLDCLSTVTRNAFARETVTGGCLKKINKFFLIAARNITISQLKDEIETETDNNHHIFNNLHVIGTSMTKLLNNRMAVHFSSEIPRAKMAKLQHGVQLSIEYIMRLLREEHPTIEPGRFIDLFNHNIREKVRFLADFIDLLTYKVEMKFRMDSVSTPNHPVRKLDISTFIDYLSDPSATLGIDVYEVQKLLILNNAGYFKNFFHHNTSNVLIPEAQRGQFDNLFNYENRNLFPLENEQSEETDRYEFSRDPLLEKFFLLFRLSSERSLPVPVLRSWFKDCFTHQRCRPTTLRQLIRSGLIMAEFVDDVIHVRLTRKGKFVYEDLLGVSVYLEHVVLNCQVPHFISKQIIRPIDASRRAWGRNSVSNVTLFLKYIQQIIVFSVRPKQEQLKKELIAKIESKMMPSVMESFWGIISEGMQNELVRDYATDITSDFRNTGIMK